MTRRLREVGSLLVGLSLGCATTVPPPAIDLPPVPEHWTTPLAAAAGSTSAWWLELDSPGLVAVVEQALASSLTIEMQQARLDAALAQARIAGADLKPQIGLGLNGSRRRQNFIGLPIPGSEDGVLSTTSTSFGLSLDTTWEVDLWGRARSHRSAARMGAEASRLDLAAARLSVVGQTAKAWVAVAEAQAQQELAAQTAQNRRVARDRIKRRFELGVSGPLDVRLSRGRHEIARANLATADGRLDAARRQLEILLRDYPAGEIKSGTLPVLPPLHTEALPVDLVARRPDLQAIEARLEQTGFSLLEAKRSLYPRLTLSSSVGRTAAAIEDLLHSDFEVWSLAGGLLQPLFQGGRLRAGVDLADARRDEMVAVYVQSLLNALGEIETLIAANAELARLEEALAGAEAESRAAERLAQREYEQGLSDYLTLLQAQSDHFQAASGLLQAQALRVSSRIDLHLALGDGLDAVAERGESRELDDGVVMGARKGREPSDI